MTVQSFIIFPVNKPGKIDYLDPFLPSKVLAYKTVVYFKSSPNKWEKRCHEICHKHLAENLPLSLVRSRQNYDTKCSGGG